MLKRTQILFKPEGGEGGSNGGGAATGGAGGAGQGAGDSGAGAGGGLLTTTGAGGAGGAAASGDKTTGNNNSAGDPSVKYPENWKLGLSKELQEDSALKVIHDIPALVKSYIHAQRAIGADKLVLPSKHATAEEWRAVYEKLGLPKDVKEYKIEAPKDVGFDDTFVSTLATKAYELGVLPTQAQALVNWMGEQNKNAVVDLKKSLTTQTEESVGKLKTEWGAAFDEKVSDAQKAVSHFADADAIKYLNESGLTNDPTLVKLFAKVAGVLKEDGIIRENAQGSSVLTPAEAKTQMGIIMANMDHPFYQKEHPNHKAAVDEVTNLRKMMNPRK